MFSDAVLGLRVPQSLHQLLALSFKNKLRDDYYNPREAFITTVDGYLDAALHATRGKKLMKIGNLHSGTA